MFRPRFTRTTVALFTRAWSDPQMPSMSQDFRRAPVRIHLGASPVRRARREASLAIGKAEGGEVVSTKLYTVRVPKDRWQEFSAAVRATYLAEHFVPKAFRTGIENKVPYSELMKMLDPNDSFVELQLFDEGDTWLVRPLEQGWFFINHVVSKAWPKLGVKKVFYDNRSDVPKKDRKNRVVADWMDKQIRLRRYLVYPVLDRASYQDLFLPAEFQEES